MDAWRDDEPVSFLGRRVPAHVSSRQVVIGKGCAQAYEPAEWAGALVIVESGELEVESL